MKFNCFEIITYRQSNTTDKGAEPLRRFLVSAPYHVHGLVFRLFVAYTAKLLT